MQSLIGNEGRNLEIIPFSLLDLEHILPVCLFEDKTPSIKTPTYLTNCWNLSLQLLILMLESRRNCSREDLKINEFSFSLIQGKLVTPQLLNNLLNIQSNRYPNHCMKSVSIQNLFGPYFPAFGLNTERYFATLRIQS